MANVHAFVNAIAITDESTETTVEMVGSFTVVPVSGEGHENGEFTISFLASISTEALRKAAVLSAIQTWAIGHDHTILAVYFADLSSVAPS